MKNLLKGELFLLLKRKVKILSIPVLVLVFLLGIFFIGRADADFHTQIYNEYLYVYQIAGAQDDFDQCVIGNYNNPDSDRLCGPEYFSREEFGAAQRRSNFNASLFSYLNRMYRGVEEKDAEAYYNNRLKLTKTAIEMEEAGFTSAYFGAKNLEYNSDKKKINIDVNRIEEMLESEGYLQISDYEINASNYLRVFLSNGGIIALLSVIMLFNLDFFIDDESLSVSNVIYSQKQSRRQVNISKLLASTIYSTLVLLISLIIGYIIIGSLHGYGGTDYLMMSKSSINNFTSLDMTAILSVGKQIIFISTTTLFLLLASLFILHGTVLYTRNSSVGLFLVYLLFSVRFVFKDLIKGYIKYFPFAYDNHHEIFFGSYSYLYGLTSLVILSFTVLLIILYIGDHIDIKGGD